MTYPLKSRSNHAKAGLSVLAALHGKTDAAAVRGVYPCASRGISLLREDELGPSARSRSLCLNRVWGREELEASESLLGIDRDT